MSPEPRLGPIPLEQWDDKGLAALRGTVGRAEVYLTGAPDAPRMPNVLGIFGHHLRLGGAWLAYNAVLLDEPSLDPRHRELAVLRVAWRTKARYEWIQHVRIGKQVGVTDEQVDAVTLGADADEWTPLERAIVAATDQLIDRHQIDDATWAQLAADLDERQLVELLFVIGSYLCLALVFNSVGLELDPEMDPSSAPALPDIAD